MKSPEVQSAMQLMNSLWRDAPLSVCWVAEAQNAFAGPAPIQSAGLRDHELVPRLGAGEQDF